MKYKNARNLIKKYLEGTATPEEEAIIESWYNLASGQEPDEIGEVDYDKIENEILQALRKQQIQQKPRVLWARIAAAASVIFAISFAGYLFFKSHSARIEIVAREVINKNIKPGGNKALLTLADGRTVNLTDAVSGEIANEAGISIKKAQSGQISYQTNAEAKQGKGNVVNHNTVTTPNGGQWRLTLADGTNVWLNAASSITYPNTFKGNNREVTLAGEAYFEVAKDKIHPFIVKTDKQDVTVLGTHFNINSYTNEPSTKTTLLEGSVMVTEKGINVSKLLEPGQAAIVKGSELNIVAANTAADVSWKNGYFTFKRADIKVVMRQFARWYDMDVAYEGEVPRVQLTGDLHREASASQALKMLSYFNVHYRVNGKKVTITR